MTTDRPRGTAVRGAPARAAAAATAVLVLPALAACTDATAGESVEVLASFYPLQYVAEQVGGDRVDVSNLTPPAAEPHDLELSPTQVRAVGESDLVVYLSGMQAATDEAVETRDPEHLVDAADAAGLERGPNGGDGAALDSGALDPHFWLDPTRLASVGRAVADELAAADPDHAAEYAANAEDLAGRLDALDGEYRDGLAPCAGSTLVVSHEAFGYLAERYDLTQVGIVGLDPEMEPSPARLREVGAIVRENDVETLYFEVLTSPQVTRTLADDLGVDVARLDPLEGQSDEGADYLDVMRANLAALQDGLRCAA